MIFPKIKEKHFNWEKHNPGTFTKKYFEINLDEERQDSLARARTDLEEELMHKCKVTAKKKDQDSPDFLFKNSLHSKQSLGSKRNLTSSVYEKKITN